MSRGGRSRLVVPLRSSPGPLASRGNLAEVDADLSEVFSQTGADVSHCDGRHLGFTVSVKDGAWIIRPRVYPHRRLFFPSGLI